MARYIDANKIKERLEIISAVGDSWYEMGINRGLERAKIEIDMLPTADVEEVKRGEWEEQRTIFMDNEITLGFRCTACDLTSSAQSLYCPNCGADMRGDE